MIRRIMTESLMVGMGAAAKPAAARMVEQRRARREAV